MKKWIIPIAIGTALTAATGTYGQKIDRSVRPTAAKAPVINIKDPEVFKLNNGITVVLSEDHKLPRVSFSLVMGGTPAVEGSKAGVNTLMGLLVLSGTTTKSKDELDKEIDYMGATLVADGNSIYFSCLTKHVNKGLSIMKDVTMNASFPQSEFDRMKKQEESELLTTKSSPDAMAENAVNKINFPNHPYGDVMSDATLASITRDDVIANFKRTFTPQGAYLVIVGDVNAATAKELAEKYFSEWKGQPVVKEELSFHPPGKGNRVFFISKPGAVQSVISISFPVNLKPGDRNQIPFNVTNNILGGGGFNTRLIQNLREGKAYTYGAYSDLNVTRNGSWLNASGSFRNEVTDSAITELLYELSRISEEYVTPEELALTKSSSAGAFARGLENPQTVARFALNIIQNGLPADYYKNYLTRLESVNQEEVLLMAQQYLRNGYNIVVVGNDAVLDKIRKFDTDGVIEKLDAFGNPAIEMKAADITTDQLIEKHLFAVTQTKSEKEMAKKLKKIKSVERKTDFVIEQMGMNATMTDIYAAPNKEYTKFEAGGMVFSSSFYNGTTGATTDVQTGKKEMSETELAEKKKTAGLFPELNYKKGGLNYELKGIENQNGKDVYVVYSTEGNTEEYDYYATDTYLKVKTVTISKEDGETYEQSVSYGDYKAVEGILFPHSGTMSIGQMVMPGTVKSIVINGKVDQSVFQ